MSCRDPFASERQRSAAQSCIVHVVTISEADAKTHPSMAFATQACHHCHAELRNRQMQLIARVQARSHRGWTVWMLPSPNPRRDNSADSGRV
jgi:hypothetical protein